MIISPPKKKIQRSSLSFLRNIFTPAPMKISHKGSIVEVARFHHKLFRYYNFSRSSKRSHLVKALEAIMDQKVVDNLSKIFMIFVKKIVEDFKKVKLQQKLD
jgi:hypothetical protein